MQANKTPWWEGVHVVALFEVITAVLIVGGIAYMLVAAWRQHHLSATLQREYRQAVKAYRARLCTQEQQIQQYNARVVRSIPHVNGIAALDNIQDTWNEIRATEKQWRANVALVNSTAVLPAVYTSDVELLKRAISERYAAEDDADKRFSALAAQYASLTTRMGFVVGYNGSLRRAS